MINKKNIFIILFCFFDYIKYFRDFIYKDKETFLERKFIIFESIDDNYKRDYSQTKRDRKKYIITDPDGKIFVIENLNKFCKENDLPIQTMRQIHKEIGVSCRGWKKYFENGKKSYDAEKVLNFLQQWSPTALDPKLYSK